MRQTKVANQKAKKDADFRFDSIRFDSTQFDPIHLVSFGASMGLLKFYEQIQKFSNLTVELPKLREATFFDVNPTYAICGGHSPIAPAVLSLLLGHTYT